ncbi:MAG: HAAS signaling domain-containing protein [Fimbriimonas sp.]
MPSASEPSLFLSSLPAASCPGLQTYLAELYFYLAGIVPEEDARRFIEETADHLENVVEDLASDHASHEEAVRHALIEYGEPRRLADDLIEAWYHRRSRLNRIERALGPGQACALMWFGIANLLYWVLLQIRVFMPSHSALHLPWSPGQIRQFLPEPIPFPDASFQFLVVTGVPLLAPPLLGWAVGRSVPVRPHESVYRVLMPLVVTSYVTGVLLLPVTDGLVFALVQTLYWIPVGCGTAYLASQTGRKLRAMQVRRRFAAP